MHLIFLEIPLTYGIMTVPLYLCLKKDDYLSMASLWSNKFFWISIKHQVMSLCF
jgi:hypothetical protein